MPFSLLQTITRVDIFVALAEFEEKQYECAFNLELGLDGSVFASGQVLEKFTGYDVVASPADGSALWRILGVPRPPGVRLVPDHWSPVEPSLRPDGSKLPSHPISLIVQFKRPEYLQGSAAAQYRLWNQPYYRFTRTAHQHLQLRRLEGHLADHATITYASPAFHRMADLENAQMRRSVVSLSGFVSPTRLGAHKVWTYIRPGLVGRGNPDGEEMRFRLFEELFEPAQRAGNEISVARNDLRQHVRVLAEACRSVSRATSRTVDSWIGDVRQSADLPDLVVEAVRDYATVQSVVVRLDATWWLLDSDELMASGASLS